MDVKHIFAVSTCQVMTIYIYICVYLSFHLCVHIQAELYPEQIPYQLSNIGIKKSVAWKQEVKLWN